MWLVYGIQSADYGRAIDLYKNALSKFMEIDDKLAQAAVCKCLCACYQALHVPSMANVFKVREIRPQGKLTTYQCSPVSLTYDEFEI